jgi:hypothetical protein
MTSEEKKVLWQYIDKNAKPFSFYEGKFIKVVLGDVPSLGGFVEKIKDIAVRNFSISLFLSFLYKNWRKQLWNQKHYYSKKQKEDIAKNERRKVSIS